MVSEVQHKLKGKTVVFSDLHLGLKGSNIAYLDICKNVVKEITKYVKSEKIKNIVFCGDFFHSRKQIDLMSLSYGLQAVADLAKHANLYLICGNHDSYFKNTTDINSIKIFKETKNVFVIDSEPETVSMNDQLGLFIPWDADNKFDYSKFEKESFDFAFGHFDFSTKYFMASYVSDNTAEATSAKLLSELNIESDENFPKNAVDLVKEGGIVYSGHIHLRKEFIAKSRQIIFIGSPYEQTFGERWTTHGFYVLDENNKPAFVEINSCPRHIILRMSEVISAGIENFDFSVVKGNIVKKLYNVQIDKTQDASINKAVSLFSPFAEALSEYEIASQDSSGIITSKTLDLIKKSKIEYIKSYINDITEPVLKELGLDKGKIFDLIKTYYEKFEV